jgi:hypothetical protein
MRAIERAHDFGLLRRTAVLGLEPTMNVDKQVRKFDVRIDEARYDGNEELAQYLEDMRDDMVAQAEAGRPQPFSHLYPMAIEEFDLDEAGF